jgi:hypothetical protein
VWVQGRTKRSKLGASSGTFSHARIAAHGRSASRRWGCASRQGLFYVGAGVGKDTNSDFNGTPWKVLAGFRPISLFAVEAEYIDLGSQTTQCVDFNTGSSCGSTRTQDKAFGAYAVGFAPIPVPYLDVFGKLGVQRWTSNTDFLPNGSPIPSYSVHSTEFAWGVGTQLHVGSIGGRLEYEGFHTLNGATAVYANVISLSLILSF